MEPLLLWVLDTLLALWNDTGPTSAAPFPNITGSPPEPSGPRSSATVNDAITAAASATGLSPNLLRAVATAESGLNPNAVSPAGAVGVMQLMPQTAALLGVDPYNPQQNVLGGAEYLKSLLAEFPGHLSWALAAYNAGPGAVQRFGGIPPYAETEAYVARVKSLFASFTPEGSSSSG